MGSFLHQNVPCVIILSLKTIISIRLHLFPDGNLFFSKIRILLPYHRIGTFRNHGSGHDPHGLSRVYTDITPVTGA